LRETCECDCGLIQRGRVLLECALQEFRGRDPIGFFEHGTILHKRLAETHEVISSAYGGGRYRSGETIRLGGQSVQHQDLTALSFADASFAGVMHNDVLEHIADYRRALAECHRVLRPGGSLVFTCPVFLYVASTLVRARMINGAVEHLLPPEVHGVQGDPDFPEGFLAFYNFGWDLVETLRGIFEVVETRIFADPLLGYTSNNHPLVSGGNMLATVFVCRKACS